MGQDIAAAGEEPHSDEGGKTDWVQGLRIHVQPSGFSRAMAAEGLQEHKMFAADTCEKVTISQARQSALSGLGCSKAAVGCSFGITGAPGNPNNRCYPLQWTWCTLKLR